MNSTTQKVYLVMVNRNDGKLPGPEKIVFYGTCDSLKEAIQVLKVCVDKVGPHYGIYSATYDGITFDIHERIDT